MCSQTTEKLKPPTSSVDYVSNICEKLKNSTTDDKAPLDVQ